MKGYARPEVITIEDLTEGIYASSGSTGENGETGNTGEKAVCNSKYMGGIHYKGTINQSINIGYKLSYGCDGCPADAGTSCRVALEPITGDYRPSWEKNGKLPDEKGW